MVAATNSALTATNAPAHTSANSPASASADTGVTSDTEGTFTQLINSLLSDSTTSSSSVTAPPTDVAAKDTKSADNSTDAATPVWLMAPYATPTPVNQVVTAAGDGGDDSIDALTLSGKGAANDALLAQSLTRMLNGKAEQTDVPGDNKITDGSVSAFITKNGSEESSLATLLNKPQPNEQFNSALLQADQKLESKTESLSARNDQLQPVATFQTTLSDTSAAAPAAQYQIHSRVGSHEWAAELGNKLSMMIAGKAQSASLQLTPDNMGPVHVKIDISNNQTSVWFTADQADTRTALEQSLPKLRELFAAQGMSLTDAGVFGQQSQQQAALSSRNSQSSFGMTDISSDATMTQQVMKIGLLDTYA